MLNIDVHILEDRDNLFRDLQKFDKYLYSHPSESERVLYSLIKIWDETAIHLWEQGYWKDYLRCGNLVLNCAKSLNNSAAQAKILNELGWVEMEQEYFTKAQEYFKDSLRKFESIDNADGQCQSLLYLGVLFHRQKRFGSAIKSYHKALNLVANRKPDIPLEEKLNWERHAAELHNSLGNLYLKLGDFPASFRELGLSLKKYRALGEEYPQYRYYQPGPLLNLGRWNFLQENYDEAKRYYRECYQLSEQLHRTDMVAGALLRLAELAEAEGNREEAIRLAKQSEQVSGTEISLVRDRASHFKYRIQGQEKRSISTVIRESTQIFLAILDLAIAAPATTIRAFQYYLSKSFWHKTRVYT